MKKQVISSIEIRNLQTVKELEEVRKLEAIVWSFEDSVPVNQTITVVKNGGFILGAFLHNELVGFQYSFPGYDGHKIYLCSHSLGIHPKFRKLGIGEKLKWAQRELALEKGYDLITWTYDPLETVNGNLNLHKLGAVCSTYLVDAYGEMDDGLNSGLPTDRFLVEWRTKDEPQTSRRNAVGRTLVIESLSHGSFLHPGEMDLSSDNQTLFVPVPGNFQEIKTHDFPLALAWREATRMIFTHYLERGWFVTNLVKDENNPNQYLYQLEKRF